MGIASQLGSILACSLVGIPSSGIITACVGFLVAGLKRIRKMIDCGKNTLSSLL
jgi:hypothetical protein